MRVLLQLWITFSVAAKRLLAQKGMTFATLLGLTFAVALTMSVPIYADGVYYRLLYEGLSGASSTEEKETANGEATWTRPPFTFLFRYLGSLNGRLQWERIQPADAYLTQSAGPALGLPQKSIVRHFRTDAFGLFPPGEIDYTGVRQPLAKAALAFVSDLEDHIKLVEGNFPAAAAPNPDSVVEVLVSEPFAARLALRPGQTYSIFGRRYTSSGERTAEFPVRIAGIWRATDPHDGFWFYHPSALNDLLLVPEETFLGRITPYMSDEVVLGLWYLIMDGSRVHAADIGPLLTRITRVQQQTAALLPNTDLDVSTVAALQAYRQAADLLTILLYAFSIPTIGLTLAFVGMVVGLSVERRRTEIAILRSRGATTLQVVGMAVQEVVLVGGLAILLGALVGRGIAHLMGQARGFLSFTSPAHLRVDMTAAALRLGLVAVGLALIAEVGPTLGASRYTVVTHRQQQARLLLPPWWQRAGLDWLLLVPAAYGAYVLRQQRSIAIAVQLGPFQNPLLFLVPVLAIAALTLFLLRILPLAMVGTAWLLARTRSVGFLLAARQLARTPGFYATPLVLLVLTLSLSAFTASLAQTLDHHLYDQTYYEVGADLKLVETATSRAATEGPEGVDSEEESPGWLALPLSEFLKVPGTRAVARVGRYETVTRLSGGTQTGTFLGIDRTDFPGVAFWRRDFASVRLGTLMNALALAPEGILVPRDFMAEHALHIGDSLLLQVETEGQLNMLDMQIVGSFDLFPTWYPEDGPLFVGNLDALFERAGSQSPYGIWLKTDPGADYEQVVLGARRLRFRVSDWAAAPLRISKEQSRPERQGLFGLLSVGFVAAAVLTVAGFLIYALFSFRRRFIELGILRAIGLSPDQMTALLAWELSFLILIGALVGTGLGVWASSLFIPYLQVGSEQSARIPPFVVEIAWPDIFRVYGLFAVLFLIALGMLVPLLLRMKIFEAVKLGETV